jgi:hypothetical protein
MCKYLKYCLVAVVIINLTSCDIGNGSRDEARELRFTEFPCKYKMDEYQVITSIRQLVPWEIFSVDSLFIIYEHQGSDHFFHVYNEGFNFIGSFGKKGNGPGEFTMAEFCGQYYKDDNGNIKLWIHDQNLFKAFKVDLLKAMNAQENDESFIEETVNLPTEVLTIPEFLEITEGELYIGRSDMVSYGRYFIFQNDDTPIKWTETYPNVDEFTVADNLTLAYHSTTRYDAINKRVVSAMTQLDQIDIFDNEMNLFKSVVHENENPSPNFLSVDHPFNDNNYTYYMDLCLTDQYIYTSYLNVPFSVLRKSIKDGPKNIQGFVHVFDLDGIPIAELQFEHSVSRFAVDQENEFIYMFNFGNEDMPLLKYKLPIFQNE